MKLLSRRAEPERQEPLIESFEGFFVREYRGVLALALALTGDRAQAEDLAQEGFMAAFAAWERIEDPGAWIRTAVSNKAMSWWRRQYASRRAMTRFTAAEGFTIDSTEAEAFWAEVRRLPRRQAQAITLFYLDDLPVSEIARMLVCSESTARTHLSRGRETLALRLGVDE
jgi:RNA polymerase sigma-70 factor (ECF subfamily)